MDSCKWKFCTTPKNAAIAVFFLLLAVACSRPKAPEETIPEKSVPTQTPESVSPKPVEPSPEPSVAKPLPKRSIPEPSTVQSIPVLPPLEAKASAVNSLPENAARTAFEAGLLSGEAISNESDALRVELWAEALDSAGELDAAISRLESAVTAATPPGVHFALSVLYGRKGLVAKQYTALVNAESAAKIRPQLIFNLAVVYGRKETLKVGGEIENFVTGAVEAANKPASIFVETIPAGAPVSLDGGEERPSPAIFEPVDAGAHTIKIGTYTTDEGLWYLGGNEMTVETKSGDRTSLRRELVPAPSRLKVVFCPIGSTLSINGVAAKEKTSTGSPYFDGEYPSGPLKIRVEAPDFDPWTVEMNLEPGRRFVVTPVMGRKDFILARKTITIDGKTDDWAGIPPAFTDDSGDSAEKKAAGSDIVAGYVCRDNDYLYWRMDFANGKPKFASGDKYDLTIGSGSTGFDLEVEDLAAHIWSQKKAATIKVGTSAVGTNFIEARFPLSAIAGGYEPNRGIGARMRFWRYKKGTPNVDLDTTFTRGLVIGQ